MSTAQLDMFAELEVQEKRAGFPARGDWAACVAFWRELIAEFNAAMLAGDTARAVAVNERADTFVDYLHGDSLGCYDTTKALWEATAAESGTVPMWGQMGTFRTSFHGSIPVDIHVEGLNGLASFSSLMPHFETRIVDKHRMFLSGTGYRSWFCNVPEAPGMPLQAVVGQLIARHVERELKGKLVKYESPEEREARQRARMAELATRAKDEPEDEPEDDPHEPCEDCGVDLSQVDEYFACDSDGALRCPACARAHAETCPDCLEAVEHTCPDCGASTEGGARCAGCASAHNTRQQTPIITG